MGDSERCCVLVPALNAIDPGCEKGLRELESRGYRVRRFHGCSPIDLARNEISYAVFQEGFEETIWIDSDIQFDANDVERLRAWEKPVCCGIYAKKGVRQLACQLLPETKRIQFGINGSLIEIKYAPAGFLHVRREVYVEMVSTLKLELCNVQYGKPFYPFFQASVVHTPQGPCYLPEDFAFSERIRQCGFSIFADTRIKLGHVGTYSYQWEDAGSSMTRFGSYEFSVE